MTPDPPQLLAAVQKNKNRSSKGIVQKEGSVGAVEASEETLIDALQRELQFDCEWPIASPP